MRRTWWLAAVWCAAAVSMTALGQRTPPGGKQSPPKGEQGEKDKQEEDKGPTKFTVGERAPEPEAEHWLNIEQGSSPHLDKYRGRLVAYYFFNTEGSAGADLNDIVKAAKKYSREVAFVGFTIQTREQVETVIKGKQVTFPVGCGAKSMMEKYNIAAPPTIYLMDIIGRFVERFNPGDDLDGHIQTQKEKTPPAGSDSQAIRNRKRQAQKLLAEHQIGKAYTAAKELSKDVDADSPDGKSVADLIKQIEDAARKLLDEAKEQSKGDNAKDMAIKTLAELSVRFAGTPIGGDADTELGRLMADGKLRSKVNKARDNAKGELKNDEAAECEATKRYLDALKSYREVTDNWPDTEAGKAAEAAIDRLNEDQEAQKIIENLRADEEADRWLTIADGFAKVEMYDKAKEKYQQIIDSHPTARATAKAKERIAKLPEEKHDEDAQAKGDAAKDKGDESAKPDAKNGENGKAGGKGAAAKPDKGKDEKADKGKDDKGKAGKDDKGKSDK